MATYEELKAALVDVIDGRKKEGLCNNIDDELNIYAGFASAVYAMDDVLGQKMANAGVLINYMRGESPYGFKYPKPVVEESD